MQTTRRRTKSIRWWGFAVILLLTVIWPCAWGADELRVRITGADLGGIVLSDSAGNSSAPVPDQFGFESVAAVPGARLERFSAYGRELILPAGQAYSLGFDAGPHPFNLEVRLGPRGSPERVTLFLDQQAPAGRAVELTLDAQGAAVLRFDSTGDGTADTGIDPDADLTGSEAADRTPPRITREVRDDGSHALALLDDGQDITSPKLLSVSIDGGRRFQPYAGPVTLDPRATPALMAMGRDWANNLTGVVRFPTRGQDRPFCERVARDRGNLQTMLREVLAAAAGDGLVSSNAGIAALAAGPGACLWRTDESGADLACDACEGAYRPGEDSQDIRLLFPASVPDQVRHELVGRLEAKALEPRFQETQAAFRAWEREIFESAQPQGEPGLAGRLALLAILLQGSYVDLGDQGPELAGADLQGILAALQAAGGVPPLEGYEAALSGLRDLLASGVMLRVAGMSRGLVPERPELDGYLGRTLRNQVALAAGTGLWAAGGILAADPCATAIPALAATRADYRDADCAGVGCRSFEGFLAARAVLAAGQCPGLFSADELGLIGRFRAVAARDPAVLAGLLRDECEANAFLGSALRFLEALGDRLAGVYGAGMDALLPLDPDAHARRAGLAADALAAVDAARSTAHLDLEVALRNTGLTDLSNVAVRMYVDGEPGPQQSTLSVAAGVRTVIAGDHGLDRPFYLRLPLDEAPPGRVHTAALVLDTGSQTNEAPASALFASYQYYALDPEEPVCPRPEPVANPESVP